MKRMVLTVLVLFVVGFFVPAMAAENPTGTWKWTTSFGGKDRENTLKLKLEGGKLTGAMLGRDNMETPIGDASFKDDTVSFTVTREFKDMKFTTKYTGKVSGNTIKGKIETMRGGKAQTIDWEAKRATQ